MVWKGSLMELLKRALFSFGSSWFVIHAIECWDYFLCDWVCCDHFSVPKSINIFSHLMSACQPS